MNRWLSLTMSVIQEGVRVRITRPNAFQGRRGIVVEAEDDRQVANVLLDEEDSLLPPPYGMVGAVEEDYEYLEVIGEPTES
jgi:hypothetical protein